MKYEDFVELWNKAATDDEAHANLPPGGSSFLHALYTVLNAWTPHQEVDHEAVEADE